MQPLEELRELVVRTCRFRDDGDDRARTLEPADDVRREQAQLLALVAGRNHDLIDPANTGLGHRQIQRWSLPADWVISARPAHPALVSEADFIAVQGIRAARDGTDPNHRYLLAGLLRCGICGRRLESCWANNRAAYRCRHGHISSARRGPDRSYLRTHKIALIYDPETRALQADTAQAAKITIGHYG